MPPHEHRGPIRRTDPPGPPSRMDDSGPLSITSELLTGDRVVIQVRGHVDFVTAAALRKEMSFALDAQPTPAVILLDLAGVTGLDTAGVGTLVVAYRICAQMGVRLRVCNPSSCVVELLTAAGVAERLIG